MLNMVGDRFLVSVELALVRQMVGMQFVCDEGAGLLARNLFALPEKS